MSELSKNKIKWIRSLQEKKFRESEGLYVIEGEKMVLEALATVPDQIKIVVHLSELNIELNGIEGIPCNEKELKQISSLQTPNKMLAILHKPKGKSVNGPFILALDGIQDPGNMGTIIRTADWFGVDTIVCSKNTVDCYNSKVVQASMGSILRLNIQYTDLREFISEKKLPVYGALLEGENVYDNQLEDKNLILLMGNEGSGISKDLIELITHPVTIPAFGKAESLNVSVATGILLSEFARSRS